MNFEFEAVFVLLNKPTFWRIVSLLRVRLMVGHIPLEDGIGVRVPDPQLGA